MEHTPDVPAQQVSEEEKDELAEQAKVGEEVQDEAEEQHEINLNPQAKK